MADSTYTRTKAWVFDVDNTLYPHHCNLFEQIDKLMTRFIASRLNLSKNDALALQKGLLSDYATTLQGLVSLHGVNQDDFLAFVHDIDYTCIPANKRLAKVLKNLPGRKIIFTNATSAHAECVLEKLQVPRAIFDHCLDIKAMNFQPKPQAQSYRALLQHCQVQDPAQVVMFDDLACNLKTAHEMGIATVLIETPSNFGRFEGDERYIDCVTNDVESFLEENL